MSKSASRTVARLLRTQNGVYGGLPRIINIDKGVSFYGYAEVNTQATTPVARVKQHKGWFSGDAQVDDGDLLQDRADGKHYLVMSLKREVNGGETAYIDGTLYYANRTCAIQRFGVAAKNAFGRAADPSLAVINTGVRIMVNPIASDVTDQEDRSIPHDKIKIVMQSKEDVQLNDRLVTNNGGAYIVLTIDEDSLDNLYVLTANKDSR